MLEGSGRRQPLSCDVGALFLGARPQVTANVSRHRSRGSEPGSGSFLNASMPGVAWPRITRHATRQHLTDHAADECDARRRTARRRAGHAAESRAVDAGKDVQNRGSVGGDGRDQHHHFRPRWCRHSGQGADRVERHRPDGPHGLAASPDKQFYYVSTAHGTPFGSFWKLRASDNAILGRVTLGNIPATAQITPEGHLAFVVNFNLHGNMVPSDVSVVGVDDMVEITRIPTCTMPHGSRLNPQGTKHYSACMMDDMLVEIDVATFTVSRHFMLTKGKEIGMSGPPMTVAHGETQDMSGHGMAAPLANDPTCSPTWAQPSADGKRIYVACNRTSDIVEIDATSWQMLRRIPTSNGVYNLGITHDGTKLIATNKRGQSVSIFELPSGKELARIPTKRKVVHGVAVSDDDRYAFISVEGIGSEPGTLEIIRFAHADHCRNGGCGADGGRD